MLGAAASWWRPAGTRHIPNLLTFEAALGISWSLYVGGARALLGIGGWLTGVAVFAPSAAWGPATGRIPGLLLRSPVGRSIRGPCWWC